MRKTDDKDIKALITEQALNWGLSIAGIASGDTLQHSPSDVVFGKLDRFEGMGTKDSGIQIHFAFACLLGFDNFITRYSSL